MRTFKEPLGHFQPNLALSILGWRWFKFFSNEGSCPSLSECNYKIVKMHWQFQNFLLKNFWTNYIQTWHKVYRSEVYLFFFKLRVQFFFKKCGDNCKNSKIIDHFEKIYHIITARKFYKLNVCKICVKSLPFYSVLEDNYFSWLLNLSQVDVTNLMN